MIPMTFHFTFIRGTTDWRWRDIHTLALLSARQYAGAQRIVVHYDREDSGPLWEAAWCLPDIEWRKKSFEHTINGHPVTDQRLVHDVHRLRTLWEEGGWYCDLDFVFLRSFETIRDTEAVIGIQCKQKSKLNCALMGAVPGAAFIQAYLQRYQDWHPGLEKTFWTAANTWPWELSMKHPVTVLPRPAFYPLAWSNKTFWQGAKLNVRNSYAVHLWESIHPDISVDTLRSTALSDHVVGALEGRSKPMVILLPPVMMTFDD